MAGRPEILLITENKNVLLEMGRDGKFSGKSNAWEDNKVIPEGEELVIKVKRGRWFIEKRNRRRVDEFRYHPWGTNDANGASLGVRRAGSLDHVYTHVQFS